MNLKIDQLEPTAVWTHFNALNAVPRASKKEERVIQFMLDFGKTLNLKTEKDAVGNVIIRKPATPGMEDRKGVVLQSHLDMVHQKNNDTVFDFDTQGIAMFVDGDWVKAEGTTLGADNGVGVAAIMAILASTDIAHPAIEALFTIDEETGMTGAKGLQGGVLTGDILLNLDTEEDTEIDIGCAGGIDVTAELKYVSEDVDADVIGYQITVKGLHGGHSGIEIHKGLGNANKILNRILFESQLHNVRVATIHGGGLRNAIPREATAVVTVPAENKTELMATVTQLTEVIKTEFKTVDAGLEIVVEAIETPTIVIPVAVQYALLRALYAAPNGVYRMSADFADLVETSNNVARVEVGDGKVSIKCLTRSSVESSKMDLATALKATFELMGATVSFSGDYPGWTPNANSPILATLTSTYERLFNESPDVVACHAGLECGILGTNYPEMDMISFGPTILGAHSPQERASISSVQKFWKFLLEILKDIPKK
ncbi:aminoacyl-histidine dipeptidase [Sphingobacterium psychroaquaticum]|uniref:Cytosol non-specific dipeptidase n=1 Tax=Sphingobacterium psychroaquaticum TaxID=561061 RepID=A0A1X7IGZ2_9SPHI|nr:aminoacyl-histidine dipeptidase [Sphingobacterium psychroaquaticum]SMG13823.1 dipeptidase D [Sphingobacterium psychroaquaticum]